jgi:hypothetical protein
MEEVQKALAVLKQIPLPDNGQRESLLGKFLASQGDHVSFDSFDIYFNHSPIREQIDLQIGSYTFNLAEWGKGLHKLAELCVLKGAAVEDFQGLLEKFNQFQISAGNSGKYSA